MIAAPQLFDGTVMRGPALVAVSGGLIESVSFGDARPPGIPALPSDAILAPGFIDIQVNGGGGVLLNDEPTEAGVRRIVEAHRRTGTTGCLPTLISDRTDVIERLAAVARGSLQIPGVLGFHLEGPALNKARKGIHLESENSRAERARSCRDEELRQLRSLYSDLGAGMRAPIADRRSHRSRTALSVGHSDATRAQIEQAADRGVTGVTHLFNAMSQLMAREPGVVGAALDDERLFAGIICDGLHVDPLSLRVAFRCKGRDRLMLVTDAMPLVGTDLRHFQIQGRRITLQEIA